ncbi:hypothetical protein MBLNU230_g1896t1 [Neophaeotheca triangularis]
METTMNHTQARPHVVTVMKTFPETDDTKLSKSEASSKPAPPVIEYDWPSPPVHTKTTRCQALSGEYQRTVEKFHAPKLQRVTELSSEISFITEAEYIANLKAHDPDAIIKGIQNPTRKNLGQTLTKGIIDGASSGSSKQSEHSGNGKAKKGKDGSDIKDDGSRGEALKKKVVKARATMEARRDGWVMVEDGISMEWDCVDDAFSDTY